MADCPNLASTSAFRNTPKYSFTSSGALKPLGKDNRPGPGQYPLVSTEKDKHACKPKWSIGGAAKGDSKASSAMPGPGAYTPAELSNQSPKWLFTTDSRLKAMKKSAGPGPGQYEVRGNMEGLSPSVTGKPDIKAMRSTTPGPGAYKPSYSPCSNYRSAPCIGFAASNRKDIAGASKMPGPGAYELVSSLGGRSYSIKGRYAMPSKEQTPGPIGAGTTFK
eukprot:TRINITY_DN110944_c0_g1_i1.p1 TRINITY_DN110944_c0_g1~~TRINITY_DN110944_c0_g1_i1.p1  ORF type:complete len:220 (+),score=35.35 TRINITY_DN110944_c0_g1_i1:73-732(+)